jgi:hypothetical protein
MREAKLKVRNLTKPGSVIVTLRWVWLGPGNSTAFWSCLPGYLSASSGYWDDKPLTKMIVLYDDDDNEVGWGRMMNLDWTGYPLSDLEGDTGPFYATRGGIVDELPMWEMISV